MRENLELKQLINEISLRDFLKYEDPVLVSKSKAVSGKLLIASEMEQLDTVGYDCVAVCVNDLLAIGAKPVLFYDSISCAKVKQDRIASIESGIERGCKTGNLVFAGSEIRELSDVFAYDQYDLVGFVAGVVDRRNEIGQSKIKDGDVIIGLLSNGLHNNGYIEAKKKLYLTKASLEVYYDSLGATLGELLLAPTKMYDKSMEALLQSGIELKSCVQVGVGGLDQAVRRLLHHEIGAVIKQREEVIPPLYDMLHKDGNISMEQMRSTFNMGIGMLLVVAEKDTDRVMEILESVGEESVQLGLAERDTDGLRYIN